MFQEVSAARFQKSSQCVAKGPESVLVGFSAGLGLCSVFQGYPLQGPGGDLHGEKHQISGVAATAMWCLLSSNHFGSLGRELGTQKSKRQKVFNLVVKKVA